MRRVWFLEQVQCENGKSSPCENGKLIGWPVLPHFSLLRKG